MRHYVLLAFATSVLIPGVASAKECMQIYCHSQDPDCNEPRHRYIQCPVECPLNPFAGVEFCREYLDCDGDGYGQTRVGYGGPDECPGVQHPAGVPWTVLNSDDCDDTHPLRHLRDLPEVCFITQNGACCDNVDNNCDGLVDAHDWDGDGSIVPTCVPSVDADCDDANPLIAPDARETTENCGVDNDCGGDGDVGDFDKDGFKLNPCGDVPGQPPEQDDCRDSDPSSYPGAPEQCDAINHDCGSDGNPLWSDADGDNDGVYACGNVVGHPDYGKQDDCDDNDALIGPSQIDSCGDYDTDCDGEPGNDRTTYDICGDQWDNDCNDGITASGQVSHIDEVEPSFLDLCDGVDLNCDGDDYRNYDFDGDGIQGNLCDYSVSDNCTCTPTQPGDGFDCVDLPQPGTCPEPFTEEECAKLFCPPHLTQEQCENADEIHPPRAGIIEVDGEQVPFIFNEFDNCGTPYDDNCDGRVNGDKDADGDGVPGFSCDPNAIIDSNDVSAICDSIPQSESEFLASKGAEYDADGDGIPECTENCLDINHDGICSADEQCPMYAPIDHYNEVEGIQVWSGVRIFSFTRYFPVRQCAIGDYEPPPEISAYFRIPTDIPVMEGDCGNQYTELKLENPEQTIVCRYECAEDGASYEFAWCDNARSVPGDEVYTTRVDFETVFGDWRSGPSKAELYLEYLESDCDNTLIDEDGDGHYPPGSCFAPADDCDDRPGLGETVWVGCNCDDYPPGSRPNVPETCNGWDDDCDGEIDEGLADNKAYFLDLDGDGVGSRLVCTTGCASPGDNYVEAYGDCDDDPNTGASVAESCGPCVDHDGDGFFGNCGGTQLDCDDSDSLIHPGAVESCDGIDNDCDCFVDEDTIEAGRDCLAGQGACHGPGTTQCQSGTITCVADETVDGEPEICGDWVDNDCDGSVDEGCSSCINLESAECKNQILSQVCDGSRSVLASGTGCIPIDSDQWGGLKASTTPNESLDGSFAVSDTGAATYTVQLELPPGRAGVQPSISLKYSSGGPNGILGLGFTLGGFSRIERCASISAYDGAAVAPSQSTTDNICLDGKTLVELPTPGEECVAQGADRELRLVDAPFTPICQFDDSNAQPVRFVWLDKSGRTHWYGTDWTSQQIVPGGNRIAWLIERSEDQYGNFIRYRYRVGDRGDQGLYLQPDRVEYTGSSSFAANRIVDFEYRKYRRDHSALVYTRFNKAERLLVHIDRIRVTLDGQEVRRYDLDYETGPSGQSRLKQIQETAEGVAKLPTVFEWNGDSPNFTRIDTRNGCPTCGVPAPPEDGAAQIADLDGDGIPEIGVGILRGSDEVYVRYAKVNPDGTVSRFVGPSVHVETLSSTSGIPREEIWPIPDCDSIIPGHCPRPWHRYSYRWGDRNLDGSNEWWIGKKDDGEDFQVFSIGPDLRPSVGRVRDPEVLWASTTGDFDGDGRFDIFSHGPFGNEFNVVVMNAPGFTGFSGRGVAPIFPPGRGTPKLGSYVVGNFDLDPADEVLFPHSDATYLGDLSSDGTTLDFSVAGGLPANASFTVADIEGDGFMDVFDCKLGQIYSNGGSGGFSEIGSIGSIYAMEGTSAATSSHCKALDYTGDGSQEVIRRVGDSRTWTIYDLTQDLPDTVAEIREIGSITLEGSSQGLIVSDLDGDGDEDLYYHDSEGDDRGPYVYLQQRSPEQIYAIREGFDSAPLPPTYEISYALPTDPEVYSPGPEGVCPASQICSPPRTQFVRSVKRASHAYREDGGPRGVRETLYRYGDARRARDGAGFLGFHWRTEEDLTFGSVHRYEYEPTVRDDMSFPTGIGGLYGDRGYTQVGVVVREQHVYPVSGGKALIRETRRTPRTFKYEHPARYFTFVEETEETEAERSHFDDVRTRLLSQGIVSEPWFRSSRTHVEMDDYGNVTRKNTLRRLDWNESDATDPGDGARSRLEKAGYRHIVEYDYANVLSDARLRRGEFNRKVESRATPLCESILGALGGATGRLPINEDTSDCPSGTSLVRETHYRYTPEGSVRLELRMTDGVAFSQRTTVYNEHGLPTSISVADPTGVEPARTTTITYDMIDGTHPFSTTNAMGRVQLASYDRRFGTPLFTQDENGIQSVIRYDAFGRARWLHVPVSIDEDGDVRWSSTEQRYVDPTPEDPAGAVVRVETWIDGEAEARGAKALDTEGRTVAIWSRGFSSWTSEWTPATQWTTTTLVYDAGGRVVARSNPRGSGDALHWYATKYDALGRTTERETVDGTFYYEYTGPELTVSGARDRFKLIGADGNPIVSRGGMSPTTLYLYHSTDGELRAVDSSSPSTPLYRAGFDALGRVERIARADLGATTFERNAFNEIISQRDAAGHSVRSHYDMLGRPMWQVGGDSSSRFWEYDHAPGRGIGKIAVATSSDGHQFRYAYDGLGKLTSLVQRDLVGANGQPWAELRRDLSYDEFGRVAEERLPSAGGLGRPVVVSEYVAGTDELASLRLEVRAGDGALGATVLRDQELVRIIRRDSEGRAVQTQHTRDNGSYLESFEIYSDLKFSYGRLTNTSIGTKNAPQPLKQYDFTWVDGRLETDADTTWDQVSGTSTTVSRRFHYVNEQVSYITGDLPEDFGTPNEFGRLSVTPGQGLVDDTGHFAVEGTAAGSFEYDDAGYLIADPERTILVNDFGRPVSLTSANGDWSQVAFEYGPNGERVQIVGGGDRVVLSGNYSAQYREVGAAPTIHQYELGVARFRIEEDAGQVQAVVEYVLDDQVGSTRYRHDAPPGISPSSSYSAYGSADGFEGDTARIQPGFAGHTSLRFGGDLVDMQARLYEPEVGQFIAPDPFVEDVLNPLAYNPYHYVLNDVGSRIDPTGMCSVTISGGIGANGEPGTIVGADQGCGGDEDFVPVVGIGRGRVEQQDPFLLRLPQLQLNTGAGPAWEGVTVHPSMGTREDYEVNYEKVDLKMVALEASLIAGALTAPPGWDIAFDLAGGAVSLYNGDYVGVALSAGALVPILGRFAAAAKLKRLKDGCFVEDTLVLTSEGYTPIENVEVGDYVWSVDPDTGEQGWKEVREVYVTPNSELLRLSIALPDGAAEVFSVTPEHPLWVESGWLQAGELLVGDRLWTQQGWAEVAELDWEPNRATVYNLFVDDYHTYFVGESGLWAHNAKICRNAPKALPSLTQSTRTAFLNSANRQVARGGVTAVGRALQKHAARPGSYFSAGKNAGDNAARGRNFLNHLFKNGDVRPFTHKVHGDVVNIRLPNGAGAQFGQDGGFIGLLEAFTP